MCSNCVQSQHSLWLVKKSSFQLAGLFLTNHKLPTVLRFTQMLHMWITLAVFFTNHTLWSMLHLDQLFGKKTVRNFGYKTRLPDLNQKIFAECLGSDPKSILKIFFLRLLLVLTGARFMSELLTNLSLVHVIYANTEWLCPGTILFCRSFTWRSNTSWVYLEKNCT